MFGHGSPQLGGLIAGAARERMTRDLGGAVFMRRFRWLCLFASVAVLHTPQIALCEQVRVRVAWGEGRSRQWRGVARVSQGRMIEARGLGLTPDSAGSISLSADRTAVEIVEPSPRNYNGIDVLVDAPLDAEFSVELRSGNDPPKRISAKLIEIATEVRGRSDSLDQFDNRILMQRSPGDSLQFNSQHESMVFATGETVRFHVQPHLLAAGRGATLDCRVRLLQGGEEVDAYAQPAVLDANGSGKPIPFQFALPNVEGVFEFELSLIRKARVQWLPGTSIAVRRVQFVVIDSSTPNSDMRPWAEVYGFDPAKKGWFDRVAKLPGVNVIPGMSAQPIDNSLTRTRMVDGQAMTELAVDGWVAYPLSIPVDRVHTPHILEVEYPTSVSQSLSISVVEPNRANEVVSPNADSGVSVPVRWSATSATRERHRIVFWPRTGTPFVLLANRDRLSPAMFSKIRLYAGPLRVDETSISPDPASPMANVYSQDRSAVLDERTISAFFSRPSFAAGFGSDRASDPARPPHGSLDDWYTFYRGASRLAQYVRYAGYNSAVVCVARDGGAIYPSQVLQPTPQFDNGVFFRTGQDPMQKDILEMLFRVFDREGIKLIPALYLSGTTPGLERQRIDPTSGQGITLVDSKGGSRFDGRRRPYPPPPFYNAVDPRVQAEAKRVVRELLQRYSSHASFGGIALQSGADTWLQFPDAEWGLDPVSVRRFLAESHGSLGKPELNVAEQILRQPESREKWMQWRARDLARFHRELETEVERSKPGAKFILTAEEMFQSPSVQNSLKPRAAAIDSLEQRLLRVGYDAKTPRLPGNKLLRVYRYVDESNISFYPENVTLNQPSHSDPMFGGAQFQHERSFLALGKAFDANSPFDNNVRTKLRLQSVITPSGQDNRHRFARALAARDPFFLLDGGENMAVGQERSVRPFLQLMRALPAQPFEDLPAASQESSGAIVVRYLRTAAGSTIMYAVNQAPWESDIEVRLDGSLRARTSVIPGVPPGDILQLPVNNQFAWRARLEAYGVAAIILPAAIVPQQWNSVEPPRIVGQLQRRIQDVQQRIGLASKPRLAKRGPINPSFERAGANIPGWSFASGQDLFVKVEPDGASRVLHLKNSSSKRVLWSRTDKFTAPNTGMIAVEVRLRTKDGSQPRLAVAIDDLSGFYEPLSVGAGTPQKIDSKWQRYPFLFKLPPNLKTITIGFDLSGPGEVWIDDIRVYDIWLDGGERAAITLQSGMAKNELVRGNPYQCQRFLESYWPRFLLQHHPAQAPRAVRLPAPPKNNPFNLLENLR